ncbi:hypothetical protein AAZX31_15G208800 [Glycine max]|uniref:Uncharacterized protein n=2 Tax=Glycine subgen. Soja TaxID=1462606 RepID=A0A445GWS0_GLYSO|nr:uncharacterized protein LOC114386631 [Glycine soja]KAG4950059.1 hypothetical protein JHK86_043298 [Glycine max]RZB65757.1 hypothetical protein D0Y65_041711 [Glycine soja]
MAVAAFKSSSRRATQSSAPSNAPPNTTSSSGRSSTRAPNPTRRSRSVSAFSRGSSDISTATEFLNKRDNPLFFDEKQSATVFLLETSTPANSARSTEPGRMETGRALFRVNSGRRTRSASQCPVSRRNLNFYTSESEAESKEGNGLKLVGSNRKGGLVGRSENGVTGQVKDLQTWSSRHLTVEVSDSFAATLPGLQTQTCDDEASTASSGFGSDEKTIKAVFEQMKSVQGDMPEASDIYETVRSEVRRAISEIQIDLESAIQRSNATSIAVTNVSDVPPDLVNPGAVELVLEIRREYARKLEESQERARNLRADLAVEEHRGRELDRILKEVLPYPKTPIIQKPRPARKSSIERRRMSKRLAEDAKAYFDECVSLSTFDSSDFSSPEDPPLNFVGPPTPSGSPVCLTEESGTRGQSMNIHYDISQPPANIDTVGDFHGQVSSITDSTETGSKPCFSFAQKPSETSALQQDIQQYIKKFEKNVLKSSTMRSNYCDPREYSFQSSAESLLIDRVLLKSRIESGSLLLCGGGGNNLLSKFSGIGI